MKKLLYTTVSLFFSVKSQAMFENLPDELVLKVMYYLPQSDAMALSYTNHRMDDLAVDKMSPIHRHKILCWIYQNKIPLFTYKLSAQISNELHFLAIKLDHRLFRCFSPIQYNMNVNHIFYKDLTRINDSIELKKQLLRKDCLYSLIFRVMPSEPANMTLNKNIRIGQHFVVNSASYNVFDITIVQ